MKHTPGPWTINKCQCGAEVCDRYHTSNGHFYQGSGYSLDDAILIAAAPDLLEELKEAIDAVKSLCFRLEELGHDTGDWTITIEDGEAAIAKAEGRTR